MPVSAILPRAWGGYPTGRAPGSMPAEVAGRAAGAIYTTTVEVPHAGWP